MKLPMPLVWLRYCTSVASWSTAGTGPTYFVTGSESRTFPSFARSSTAAAVNILDWLAMAKPSLPVRAVLPSRSACPAATTMGFSSPGTCSMAATPNAPRATISSAAAASRLACAAARASSPPETGAPVMSHLQAVVDVQALPRDGSPRVGRKKQVRLRQPLDVHRRVVDGLAGVELAAHVFLGDAPGIAELRGEELAHGAERELRG